MNRVLIIGSFQLPDGSPAALYISGIKRILEHDGFSVFILDLRKDKNCINNDSINTISLKSGRAGVYQEYFSWRVVKDYIINEYDIIMPYNFPAWQSISIQKYCKKNNIKYVPVITEWHDSSGLPFYERPLKSLDILFRMKFINPKADGMIVCSEFLANYYSNVTCLLIPTIANPKNTYQKKLPSEKIRLVYFGNPGIYKENLGKFISALQKSKLKKVVVFDIYGIDIEKYNKNFSRYYYLTKKDSNICCHGKIPHSEIELVLKSADFSVVFREDNRVNRAGFPTKLGISISHGVPVLVTDVGDSKNYVGNGKNGYVIPKEEEELTKYFNKYLKAKREIKCNTNEFAEEKYFTITASFFEKIL